MNTQTISNREPALLRTPQLGASRTAASSESFRSVLGRTDPNSMSPEQRAREGAEQLVSVALVQPVFKQLREANEAAGPFAPGKSERTFRGMMDAQLSQHVVKSGHWGLVDRVAQMLLRKQGQGQSPVSAAEPQAGSSDARQDASLAKE
jgi:Rod binding domain-containing protein